MTNNKPPLQLFILRTKKGGSEVRDETGVVISFNNKMAAKAARDELGGDTVVSFGPDHKLYFQR